MSGSGAAEAFAHEAGGHRFQRVPPNEKRGRVHTSTITVSVLPMVQASEMRLDDRDLTFKACRGSGAGGQHRNKTDSAIQLTHIPTGLMVRVESERSQHQNLQQAKAIMRAHLQERARSARAAEQNARRRADIGGGARGDKRRTIRLQADQVVDHVTGGRMSAKRYMRGFIDLLWRSDE
ncbi:MAG: peptide chain release factor-like protein [Bradymonadia bacterium]